MHIEQTYVTVSDRTIKVVLCNMFSSELINNVNKLKRAVYLKSP